MFDVRLFGKPAFVAVVCQPFTVTLGFVILLVYLPAYLQGAGGRSVAESGLLLLPMTAPVLILPLIAAFIAARTSLRAVLTAASLLIAIGGRSADHPDRPWFVAAARCAVVASGSVSVWRSG